MKIDVHDKSLTMEFYRKTIRFNIFEAMRYPSNVHSLCVIDIIDSLARDRYNLQWEDGVEVAIKEHIIEEEPQMPENVKEAVGSLSTLPPLGKY